MSGPRAGTLPWIVSRLPVGGEIFVNGKGITNPQARVQLTLDRSKRSGHLNVNYKVRMALTIRSDGSAMPIKTVSIERLPDHPENSES